MSKYEGVMHYVSGMKARPDAKEDLSTGLPFITISRQAGAGGHSLARALGDRMKKHLRENLFQGWQVFDREICEEVSKDPKLKVSLDTLVSEEFHGSMDAWLRSMIAGTAPQEAVYRRVFKTVRTIASLGKAVILGRGAAHLTKDFQRGIHVRLVAPEKIRIQRTSRRLEISLKEAERRVKTMDASRARLVETCFNADVSDPLLYDAVWNTDRVAIDHIAELLIHLIRQKARERDL